MLKSYFFKGQPIVITLEKKVGNQHTLLFKKELAAAPGPVFDYASLTRQMEILARSEWPTLLKKEGFPVDVTAKNPAAKSKADTLRRLDAMNYLDQFAAVRELHIALRQDGESPWLIGDLARGYAQLGRLTEFHWNTGHKVCQARARFCTRLGSRASRLPESPWWSQWHQAFAAGLAGFPEAGLQSLATAEKRGKTWAPAIEPPIWIATIKASCRSDRDGLAKQSSSLARVLELSVIEQTAGEQKALAAALALLEANPDCYAVWDVVSASRQLGVLHKTTVEAAARHEPRSAARGCWRSPKICPAVCAEFVNNVNELRLDSGSQPAQVDG